MLGVFVKLLLVITSFAPILLTVGFILGEGGHWSYACLCVAGAAACAALCQASLNAALTKLERLPFPVTSVKTADKEIVGFVLAYLLPLTNVTPFKQDPLVLGFVLLLFFVVVMTTNSYHFNPLMGLLGYHFYEAISGNIGYILITRKSLRNTTSIKHVGQLTEYMVMDLD